MMVAIGIGIVAVLLLLLSGSGATPEGSGPLPSGAAPGPLPGGHTEWDEVIRAALRLQLGLSDVDQYAVLMKAIIQQESGWNTLARGDYDPIRCPAQYRGYAGTAGYCALGLGQIHRGFNPDLAATYDLLDPRDNIRAIAAYLARARATVGDDVQRLAAAYNGGVNMGLAWPNVPAQIDRYVASVSGLYDRWASEAGLA